MRRNEREITDQSTMEELLRRAPVGHLGLSLDDLPYVVPVHFYYAPGRIFFHGADDGRKMECLRSNPRVCFEVSEFVGIVEGNIACRFSANYRSVLVFGTAREVTDPAARLNILRDILSKYADAEWAASLDNRVVESYPSTTGGRTAVVEIAIEEMTGKARLH